MADFYVYIHTRNDTDEVFYVGKGKGIRHLAHDNRNAWWQKIVNRHGFKSMIVERFVGELDAFAMERYLIASYRALGLSICNQTEGGDGISGYVHTEQSKLAISERMKVIKKGVPRPPEVIEKMAVANRTRTRSPEEVEKRRLAMMGNTRGTAHKGRKLSEDTKAKMKAAWVRTPEARERTRLGSLGKKYSTERVAKAQAAKAGWTHSDESKAQISAAGKARWAAKKAAELTRTD